MADDTRADMSILTIHSQDNLVENLLKNNTQYTHIDGTVHLCLNRCGQNLDDCKDTHLMNMVNTGKLLVINPNKAKNDASDRICRIRKAFDDSPDDEEGFGEYQFEKMLVSVPGFHKVDGAMYDGEVGLLFSRKRPDGETVYMMMCVLINANQSEGGFEEDGHDLVFYTLMNELFGEMEKIPTFSSKKEIGEPPNPVQISDLFPPYGERSFYEYTYNYEKGMTYRVFQRVMYVSSKVIGNLREKLTPSQLYTQFRDAIQNYENPKKGLIIFYKEDLEGKHEKDEEIETEVEVEDREDSKGVENYQNEEEDEEDEKKDVDVDDEDEDEDEQNYSVNSSSGDRYIETAIESQKDITSGDYGVYTYVLVTLCIVTLLLIQMMASYVFNVVKSGTTMDESVYYKILAGKGSKWIYGLPSVIQTLSNTLLILVYLIFVILMALNGFKAFTLNDHGLVEGVRPFILPTLNTTIILIVVSFVASFVKFLIRMFSFKSDVYDKISFVDSPFINVEFTKAFFKSFSNGKGTPDSCDDDETPPLSNSNNLTAGVSATPTNFDFDIKWEYKNIINNLKKAFSTGMMRVWVVFGIMAIYDAIVVTVVQSMNVRSVKIETMEGDESTDINIYSSMQNMWYFVLLVMRSLRHLMGSIIIWEGWENIGTPPPAINLIREQRLNTRTWTSIIKFPLITILMFTVALWSSGRSVFAVSIIDVILLFIITFIVIGLSTMDSDIFKRVGMMDPNKVARMASVVSLPMVPRLPSPPDQGQGQGPVPAPAQGAVGTSQLLTQLWNPIGSTTTLLTQTGSTALPPPPPPPPPPPAPAPTGSTSSSLQIALQGLSGSSSGTTLLSTVMGGPTSVPAPPPPPAPTPTPGVDPILLASTIGAPILSTTIPIIINEESKIQEMIHHIMMLRDVTDYQAQVAAARAIAGFPPPPIPEALIRRALVGRGTQAQIDKVITYLRNKGFVG